MKNKPLQIGFTGTQKGMNTWQQAALVAVLTKLHPTEFHHGDCIGADAQAHDCALDAKAAIVIHPPIDIRKRAFCGNSDDNVRVPRPYLKRNQNIVDETALLIAAPSSTKETLRSGTWATVRYARKKGKTIIFLFP